MQGPGALAALRFLNDFDGLKLTTVFIGCKQSLWWDFPLSALIPSSQSISLTYPLSEGLSSNWKQESLSCCKFCLGGSPQVESWCRDAHWLDLRWRKLFHVSSQSPPTLSSLGSEQGQIWVLPMIPTCPFHIMMAVKRQAVLPDSNCGVMEKLAWENSNFLQRMTTCLSVESDSWKPGFCHLSSSSTCFFGSDRKWQKSPQSPTSGEYGATHVQTVTWIIWSSRERGIQSWLCLSQYGGWAADSVIQHYCTKDNIPYLPGYPQQHRPPLFLSSPLLQCQPQNGLD